MRKSDLLKGLKKVTCRQQEQQLILRIALLGLIIYDVEKIQVYSNADSAVLTI